LGSDILGIPSQQKQGQKDHRVRRRIISSGYAASVCHLLETSMTSNIAKRNREKTPLEKFQESPMGKRLSFRGIQVIRIQSLTKNKMPIEGETPGHSTTYPHLSIELGLARMAVNET